MSFIAGTVIKTLAELIEPSGKSIDTWSFKVSYKATPALLIVCAILVSQRQYYGEPISCDAGAARGGIDQDVLESFCWMYSTFNIPREYKGACSAGGIEYYPDSIVYNSYYQWVPLYLTFMAVIFYIPRLLWLCWEGGLMKFFTKGTSTREIEDKDEKKERLVKFFSQNIKNKYNTYFFGFVFCEHLNFFIVVFQFLLTHKFLNHRFLDYGFKVWQYYLLPTEEQQMFGVINPMCNTFPRIASCTYWRWGGGGHQENINAICILGLNIVNDKVFLVIWWWYSFVSLVTLIRLICRYIQCRFKYIRYQLIHARMNRYFRRSNKTKKIEEYLRTCKLGDWFVLYQLSKNLNRSFFMDFLSELSVRYDEKEIIDPTDTGDTLVTMLLKPSYTSVEGGEDKDHDVV